jgi:3-oxoacyl-(acyl-carrier-protein) synthase
MSEPIWVTGLGVVCTAGVGAEAFGAALFEPAPVLNPSPKAREGLSVPPALVFAEEFPAEDYVDRRLVRKASGLSRIALAACAQAFEGAKLAADAAEREAAGIVIGTSLGSSDYYLRFYEALLRKGPKGANAVLFTEGVFNAPSGHASKLCGLHGAGHTLVGGEEAGLSAALLACDRIALGVMPAALCGGAESYCDLALASLYHEGRVGDALAGIDAERAGPFAEGAATLFLERAAGARARGAQPRAQVLGGVRTRGALGDPAGVADALRGACEVSGLSLDALDLVIGGASGGRRSAWEAAGLTALRSEGLRAAVAAPGSHLGEGLAFGSAALLVSAVLALEAQRAPVTRGGWSAEVEVATKDLQNVAVLASSDEGAAVALILAKAS